jgi:hypothetical protein
MFSKATVKENTLGPKLRKAWPEGARQIFLEFRERLQINSPSRIVEHVSMYTQPMPKKAVLENPNYSTAVY